MLKISFLGHATVIIELDGARLIMDPHFYESFGNGHFGYFPPRRISMGELSHLDGIIISHSHRDHFDVQSIFQLDRRIPIFCPSDAKINYALSRMGFKEVVNVTDWTTINLSHEFQLVWTPSLYRVPEHGVAVRAGDVAVWNAVDTVVRGRETPQQALTMLGVDHFDLVMMPCLPFIETQITDGKIPEYRESLSPGIAEVMDASRAKALVSFADGHFYCGRSAWMNAYKFPMSKPSLFDSLRESIPNCQIVEATCGDRLSIRSGQSPKVSKCAVPYVEVHRSAQERRFDPASYILPLRSSRNYEYKFDSADIAAALLHSIVRQPLRTALSRRHVPSVIECATYRFSLIDPDGVPDCELALNVHPDGRIEAPADIRCSDVEVAVPTADLDAMLSGTMAYSTAYLGGRIRERRTGSLFSKKHELIEESWKLETGGSPQIVSGILLLNLILRSLVDPVQTTLAFELDQLERGLRLPNFGAEEVAHFEGRLSSEIFSATVPFELWNRIEECLAADEDPAHATGLYASPDGIMKWWGVFGDGAWPEAPANVSSGHILPISLVEAQPQRADGVRFPQAGYQQLIKNVQASGIPHWSIEFDLPDIMTIEEWRLPSLFPMDPFLFERDLRQANWVGSIANDRPLPTTARFWWRGMPDAQHRRRHCEPNFDTWPDANRAKDRLPRLFDRVIGLD